MSGNDNAALPGQVTEDIIRGILRCTPYFLKWLKNRKEVSDLHNVLKSRENNIDYLWYRLNGKYTAGGNAADRLLSRKSFNKQQQAPSPNDMHHASSVGLLRSLEEIILNSRQIVHTTTHAILDFGTYEQTRDKLVSLAGSSYDAELQILDSAPEEEIQLKSFYQFIFLYLKEEGFQWHFQSAYLRDILNFEGKLEFETAFYQYVLRPPEDFVEAYREIFGNYPKGFPPTVHDF